MKLFTSICVLLISLSVSAQRQYTKEWKRIDSLIEKTGLIKTALAEVNKVYSSAKKENNDVQLIKALVYRMSLNDQLSEQGRYENIALLEKEITTSKEPARSILHSIAGGSYWHYLQMNRWQFYQRTTTRGYNKDDIATWSMEQLYGRITSHYQLSLSNNRLLKETKLDKYDPIIIKGNARHLRPTLFDLLVFRALDYFRNDERYVTTPAYAFEISDSMAFSDASKFSSYKFVTKDSLSNHHKALEIYQQLLSFHLADTKPDALIDADLDRLQFVKNFGTHPSKDDLYKKALENIINKNPDNAAVINAMYYLAEWYVEKGRMYDPVRDTTNRFAIVRARELCEQALSMKVGGEGTINSKNLLKQILQQEISLKAEQVNTRNDAFRVLVNYRNITGAYFRIIKYDFATRQKTGADSWDDNFWKAVKGLPSIKTYQFGLPATNDYQLHRVEIKIDSLPLGDYAILASATKDFALQNNALTLQQLYVSDISFVSNNMKNYVLNRKTGGPIAGAKVQLWEEYYNETKRKADIRKLEAYSTDENGYFEIKNRPAEMMNRNFLYDISFGNDRLFLQERLVAYTYGVDKINKDSIHDQTFLFTDRSIYRPGQTIFFKGILVTKKIKESISSVIPNRESVVILENANGELIDSMRMTSNTFGSFSGKFTLPEGTMNGIFTLRDAASTSFSRFRVEEYKRPKFYVDMLPPPGTYRVNDTIKIQGTATSYAGNNINGASVTFRVVRRVIIPMWEQDFGMRIWPPYERAQMEIAHGNTVIDINGKFTIAFTAIPDNKIPKSTQPVFDYIVTTDVTDMNGETRSGSISVSAGYQAMKLELQMPGVLHTDSLKTISVRTTNMSDSFEKAAVQFTLYKLVTPAKVFRERYWEQPDQFIMSRNEYYKNFPFDQYSNENDKTKWQKQNAVIQFSDTTTRQGIMKTPGKISEAGWYLADAWALDKYGDTARDRKYVLLYNDRLVSPEAGSLVVSDKKEGTPGDRIHYSIITNIDSAYIIHEVVRKKGVDKTVWKTLNKNVTKEITINNSDQEAIILKTVFVKNNRLYPGILDITIPASDKQLRIDYLSFRDKTLPGIPEKWKIKISGPKRDKVAAELLTTMYDASLDQFYPHEWPLSFFAGDPPDRSVWSGHSNFTARESVQHYFNDYGEENFVKEYDRLKTPDEGALPYAQRGKMYKMRAPAVVQNEEVTSAVAPIQKDQANQAEDAVSAGVKEENGGIPPPAVQPRKNLNETAFFFPDLHTDSSGVIEISFTTPEALTTWKWKMLAHTRDLAYAFAERSMITQKQLMVQPNVPRFFREGDSIIFAAKVANMSLKNINGQVKLALFDPITGKAVEGLTDQSKGPVTFSAAAGQSVPVSFSIKIPAIYSKPLTWRIIATADNNDVSLSDGEEGIIPVLSNRMLVTETMTMPIRGEKTKSFNFEKLLNSGSSKTLKNERLTIEFTSNPAWYAVLALPYLTEEKDEHSEQLFNRFYANALASKLAGSYPALKTIISKWKESDTSAFLSNLQKNQDLKSILLEETPWVLDAKTETQQKKNIALLFDLTRMSRELSASLLKLAGMQLSNGGFSWFKGGPDDRYMTQYILAGIGHLKKLGVNAVAGESINDIARKALNYTDREIKKDYDRIRKNNKKMPGTFISYDPVQYLYLRSFFKDIAVPREIVPAYQYFMKQAKQGWVKQSSYMRAMIALTLLRSGDAVSARKIVAALKESAIDNEELGMYWKDMSGGYYWYQAPVETQSVLIEAFSEISKDTVSIGNMKTWLLKNKQTNNWRTSRATADACYALLLEGENWITYDVRVTITAGNKIIPQKDTQAGTGYFMHTIPGDSVQPASGNIRVEIKDNISSRPAWGAVYWQYFEDLDKITGAATALKIEKKLFVQKNTDRGPVIELLKNNTLKVGDRVKVRIEIRTDRAMEYVHLKDMRSSCMEPVNVLSEYKWQGGLGYYESTKDASTNFFFSYLPKGVHIFEYDLFVGQAGNFSNGVATIQCMYAPEFSSHSEGIKVNVIR